MTQPTILVLGAAGRLGAACVQAYAGAGWRVLAQRRRAPAAPLPRGAEFVGIPLQQGAQLAARAAGATEVLHAVNPLYTRWDAELLPLFRQGLDVARQLGARFLLPGNVYNYGSSMPVELHEDTPSRPDTPKGRLRVLMEDELAAAAARGQDSLVLRAGDFFGAGSGSWLDLVVAKDLRRGRLVYPGPLDRAHAWAYLPDLAQAFVAVAAAPRRRGLQRLHFAGHTLTGQDFIAALDEAAGTLGLRPARGFRVGGMPWGLIRAGGLVHPMWRELARMSYLWRVPHGLNGDALAACAGPLPATPIVAALRAALLDLGFGSAASAVGAGAV